MEPGSFKSSDRLSPCSRLTFCAASPFLPRLFLREWTAPRKGEGCPERRDQRCGRRERGRRGAEGRASTRRIRAARWKRVGAPGGMRLRTAEGQRSGEKVGGGGERGSSRGRGRRGTPEQQERGRCLKIKTENKKLPGEMTGLDPPRRSRQRGEQGEERAPDPARTPGLGLRSVYLVRRPASRSRGASAALCRDVASIAISDVL